MTEELKTVIKSVINDSAAQIAKVESVEFKKEGDQWRVGIMTDNVKELIGDKGRVINAIQHYIRVAVHRKLPDDRTHFLIDINFRKLERESLLTKTIPSIADKNVLEKGKTVVFTGLNSYERLLVHKTLKEVKGIETTSVGEGVARKLIIRPTSEAGSLGIDNALIIPVENLLAKKQ